MHIEHDIEIGSEKMVQAGIFARIIMNVWSAKPEQGGVVVISIHDLTLRVHEGRWAIWMPRREYKVNSPQGEQTRWQQLVWVYPRSSDSYQRWIDHVAEKYKQKCEQSGIEYGKWDPNYGADRKGTQVASSANVPPPPPVNVPAAPQRPPAPPASGPTGTPAAPAAPPPSGPGPFTVPAAPPSPPDATSVGGGFPY